MGATDPHFRVICQKGTRPVRMVVGQAAPTIIPHHAFIDNGHYSSVHCTGKTCPCVHGSYGHPRLRAFLAVYDLVVSRAFILDVTAAGLLQLARLFPGQLPIGQLIQVRRADHKSSARQIIELTDSGDRLVSWAKPLDPRPTLFAVFSGAVTLRWEEYLEDLRQGGALEVEP